MRCWAEINLENLRKNVIELEKITAKKKYNDSCKS